MNPATILVLLAVAAAFVLALRAVLRRRGGGCSGCSGDCASCGKKPKP